ncbi:MAG: endopeptidase La [Bacteroidota bacterium]|nr:endopeptidase La [Bacteroidota bacterium]
MNEDQILENLDEEIPESSSDLVVVSEILPDKLIVIPVAPRPVFPHLMIPLTLSGQYFVEAVKTAYEREDRMFGVVLVKNEDEKDFLKSELYHVGTVMKIYKYLQVSESVIQVFAQGLERFEYVRTLKQTPLMLWEVKYHYDPLLKPDEHLRAYLMSVMTSVKELLKTNQLIQEQVKLALAQMSYDKPGAIVDLVATILSAEPEKLQDMLETFDIHERIEKLLILLREELEVARLQEKIQQEIEEKISKQQKEFFLREQLKVIKRELGLEKDDKQQEIERFESRIKELKLTDEASIVIRDELTKMNMMDSSSPEYHVTRNYLNELTSLPWGIYTNDNQDIREARKVLDHDHYGLQDVKERILEFIGTVIKKGTVSGSIICLVGPPGVGKTSVGRSIAGAMNRKFFRFSVGGMRDEAEIKGHRRTYIGAMPGKMIQCLKRTGSANPVIMLDEIDKIGMSYQGDPASALLEVLDPEQNKDFLDHYLDVRFDLSKVLFITTANQLDTIPGPLLDRMEIISLSGYIRQEKVEIAKRYLVPKQMEYHGLTHSDLVISDKALEKIIEDYAREAGVRGLENQIKKIMRKVTLDIVERKKGAVRVTLQNLEHYLGKAVFSPETLYERIIPGVTLGLAWTAMGGATLYIEASALKSEGGGFKQTGQLGNVMRESTEIAYSYVQSFLEKNTNDEVASFFKKHFVHLHVPAGATPKDGPSAGITMALALYSLATGVPIRPGLAMTGELTLTGKVLPIGGVREKTIAARRVGVFDLIFPKENKKDFEELPAYVRKGINARFVDYFEEVLKIAFDNIDKK